MYRIGGNFCQFCNLLSWAKFLSVNFCLVLVIYIEDMATFTRIGEKFIPSNISAIHTKVPDGLGEIFCPAKIFSYTVHTPFLVLEARHLALWLCPLLGRDRYA